MHQHRRIVGLSTRWEPPTHHHHLNYHQHGGLGHLQDGGEGWWRAVQSRSDRQRAYHARYAHFPAAPSPPATAAYSLCAGLVSFIADLRNARARELEEKRINKELANIRWVHNAAF